MLEQIHNEVKIVAEQHGSIREDIKEFKDSVNQRFDRVKVALMENSRDIKKVDRKLDAALDNHEKRIQKVEERVGIG